MGFSLMKLISPSTTPEGITVSLLSLFTTAIQNSEANERVQIAPLLFS